MPAFDVNAYIDVQERINRFWTECPEGRIETELMSPPDDFTQCRYVARIYKTGEPGRPADVTGWAFELAGGSGANRTSHEENAETSAIGRALANMGYATTREDRPSRQEMQKANGGKVTRMAPTPRGVVNAMPTGRAAEASNGQDEPAPNLANAGQVSGITRMWAQLGRTEDELTAFLFDEYAQDDPQALTFADAGSLIVSLSNELAAQKAPARA